MLASENEAPMNRTPSAAVPRSSMSSSSPFSVTKTPSTTSIRATLQQHEKLDNSAPNILKAVAAGDAEVMNIQQRLDRLRQSGRKAKRFLRTDSTDSDEDYYIGGQVDTENVMPAALDDHDVVWNDNDDTTVKHTTDVLKPNQQQPQPELQPQLGVVHYEQHEQQEIEASTEVADMLSTTEASPAPLVKQALSFSPSQSEASDTELVSSPHTTTQAIDCESHPEVFELRSQVEKLTQERESLRQQLRSARVNPVAIVKEDMKLKHSLQVYEQRVAELQEEVEELKTKLKITHRNYLSASSVAQRLSMVFLVQAVVLALFAILHTLRTHAIETTPRSYYL
jgi:hypothetical protein